MRVEVLDGDALDARLDEVAALRMKVFRAYPYLYDGDMEYERKYLQAYRDSDAAIVVAALYGETLVGAATAAPMEDHASDFAAPFAQTGLDLSDIWYCAESVLLPEYRGQGIGHAFFDKREERGRELGRSHSCFCSVVRPADHPLKPEGYVPLHGFWKKRGYAPLPGVVAEFSWKDVDQPEETRHELQFWIREL